MNYENYILAYYYYLFLIFRDFNLAKLEVFFSTKLPSFYRKLDKERKISLKYIFKFIYYQVKQKMIMQIVTK